jgi:hypothetical protein
MTRVRETKLTFYLSEEQKTELDERARHAGLTVSNYLRSLLGWPLERQGARKDLVPNGGQEWTNKQKP